MSIVLKGYRCPKCGHFIEAPAPLPDDDDHCPRCAQVALSEFETVTT